MYASIFKVLFARDACDMIGASGGQGIAFVSPVEEIRE